MKFLRYCLRLLTFIFPSSWGLFSWLTLFQISVSPLWMVSLRSKNTDGYSISKWAGASLLSERNGVEKSIYVIEIALGQSGQFEHCRGGSIGQFRTSNSESERKASISDFFST